MDVKIGRKLGNDLRSGKLKNCGARVNGKSKKIWKLPNKWGVSIIINLVMIIGLFR